MGAWLQAHVQESQDARFVLQDVIEQACNVSPADVLLGWRAAAGESRRLDVAASRIEARRAAGLMRHALEVSDSL